MLSRRKKLLKKGLLQTNEEKDGSSENGTRELDDMSGLVPVPVPFERYCESKPFKFIVGSEKKEFTIHSDLVALQSPKLEALVHGELKEAQEHCVNWEYEEVDTFLRFGQFVYTGQYKSADPEPRQVYGNAPPFVKPDNVNWDEIIIADETKPQKKLEPSTELHLWPRFTKLYPSTFGVNESNPNESKGTYDLTEVFLSHAKVYVFADYHGIEELQILALQNLRKVLSRFWLTEDGLHDITQLARYCFEHTTDQNGVGDRLAELVGLYAASHLKHLWRYEEFRSLVDMPNFSHGLITMALSPGSLN